MHSVSVQPGLPVIVGYNCICGMPGQCCNHRVMLPPVMIRTIRTMYTMYFQVQMLVGHTLQLVQQAVCGCSVCMCGRHDPSDVHVILGLSSG